jgi:hypothetical protein
VSKLSYHTSHCIALIEWAHRQAPAMPALNTLIYIPNDAKRSPAAAGITKAMGLRTGVWDYLLACGGNFGDLITYKGLWIEFKSPKDGLSPEQSWWGELMRANGYATHVSRTWPNSATVLKAYIERKRTEICWQ